MTQRIAPMRALLVLAAVLLSFAAGCGDFGDALERELVRLEQRQTELRIPASMSSYGEESTQNGWWRSTPSAATRRVTELGAQRASGSANT